MSSGTPRQFAAILALFAWPAIFAVDYFTTSVGWILSTPGYVWIAVVITVAAAYACGVFGRAAAGVVAVGYALAFTTLFFWPLTPRKLFFRDMLRISPGMSRAEVHAITARWLPGTPFGLSPALGGAAPADLEAVHHGEGDPQSSGDYCVVRFANERVAAIEFVYD